MPRFLRVRTARPSGAALAPCAARGVTLVELCVVLAVLAILAVVGAPPLARLVDSARLTMAANEFLGAMYLARSEAIKRRARTVLCKSPDGRHCARRGGWEQGWIVYRDDNNNGAVDPGEVVIHRAQPLPGGFSLTGNGTLADYISYAPTGRTRMTSGAFQAGTLTLCRLTPSYADGRQIVINSSGRARVNREAGPSC